MYQVLGPKILIGVAGWLAVSIVLIAGHFGMSVNARVVVAVVDMILLIGLANPVWQFVWNRTGPVGRGASVTMPWRPGESSPATEPLPATGAREMSREVKRLPYGFWQSATTL